MVSKCIAYIVHVLINTQLWGILGAFSLSEGTQANLSAKV